MTNPFIEIFESETRYGHRSSFYYVSEDLAYEEGGERILKGIKLNCKFVPSMYCLIKPDVWEMSLSIAMVKDIGIDEPRCRKGYFTEFIAYLLTLYGVVYLESVQPKWLNDYLSRPSSKWIRQGGPSVTNYILTK